MSINTVHVGGGYINFLGTGAFALVGAQNVSIDPGLKEVMEYATGQVDPSFIATMTSQPMITASVLDIGTAISNGITYDPPLQILTGGAGLTSVDVYSHNAAASGTRTTGGTHFKTTVSNGMVVPKSIKAQQGQAASMDLEIISVYDGTNNPFIYAGSVSLPATPALSQLFTVGKVEINGTELAGVTGITFDFGWEVEKLAATGQVFDTFVYVKTRKPRFTITTKELPSLNTFGLTGTAQNSSTTAVWFQAMALDGTRIAAGTTSHIKFTLSNTQGMIWCQPFGGQNNATAEGNVIIQPQAGSSATLTVSAAAAIS